MPHDRTLEIAARLNQLSTFPLADGCQSVIDLWCHDHSQELRDAFSLPEGEDFKQRMRHIVGAAEARARFYGRETIMVNDLRGAIALMQPGPGESKTAFCDP